MFEAQVTVGMHRSLKFGSRSGMLLKSMYGTRNAARNWEAEYSATCIEAGLVNGVGHPSLFAHGLLVNEISDSWCMQTISLVWQMRMDASTSKM